MGRVELPGSGTSLTPLGQVIALGVKFHYAGITVASMTVGDEDISIGRHVNVRWHIEVAAIIACHAGGSQRQQPVSQWTELNDDMTLAFDAGW